MKKMLLVLIMSLSISSQAVELDKFINPLFYEDLYHEAPRMEPTPYALTPTSITLSPKHFDYAPSFSDCRLIDQSQTRLLYKCFNTDVGRYNYPEELKYYELFVLTGALTEYKTCYDMSYTRDFRELKLDYNPSEGNTRRTLYYIKSDDCGVTEGTNPSQ